MARGGKGEGGREGGRETERKAEIEGGEEKGGKEKSVMKVEKKSGEKESTCTCISTHTE